MRVLVQKKYIVPVIVLMFMLVYFWPISLGRMIVKDSAIPNFTKENIEKIRVIEQLNFFSVTGEFAGPANEYIFSNHSEIAEVYAYLNSLRLIRRVRPSARIWNTTHNYTIILRVSSFEERLIILNNSDEGVFLRIGGGSYRVLMSSDELNEFHMLLMSLKNLDYYND